MTKRLLLLLLLCLLPGISVCAQELPEQPGYTSLSRITTDHFSTASILMLYDDYTLPGRKEAFEKTFSEIKALLAEIDAAISLSDPQSDVSRYNALSVGKSITVSPITAEILTRVFAVQDIAGTLYDPSVSRLVDLYGFTPRFREKRYAPSMPYDREQIGDAFPPPDEKYVAAFRQLTGFTSASLSGLTLTKLAPPVEAESMIWQQELDLGGIGKGYAVDQVMALLREKGYQYGYFSCGGSSIGVLGRAKSSIGASGIAQWGVSIEKPRFSSPDDQVMMRVFTKNMSLSTSGDYMHTYMYDGTRFCHIIDPATGYPVNLPQNGVQRGICSVTVFGPDAAVCDALSTALCAAGLEASLGWYNDGLLEGYELVFVLYSSDSVVCEFVTSLPEDSWLLLDEEHYANAGAWQDGRLIYTGTLLVP